ncbi:hypothetical protein niasHT_019566 [Heterodera trifolii]|uniref:Integrase catalytic domain-containing protein n=1 Tax=Heterodera trifolii TaxID=157864 RepID=A0ABD2L834_9BILA
MSKWIWLIFKRYLVTNRGHRYLLVAIDVLSKRLFVVPLKNKKAEEMLEAFKELIEQMPMVPHRIFSDKGTEFKNKLVNNFFLRTTRLRSTNPCIRQ